MEKRRSSLRLAAAAGLIFSSTAQACVPPLDGTRLESPRFVLAFKPEPISVAQHFAVNIAVCSKSASVIPESIKVDAHMPEHRHGMNYAPEVKPLGAGRWRAEGLMFHMPGKWEFVFEIRAAGRTDRVAHDFVLSQFSKEEIAKILQHGPWPPKASRDPSNRVSGKPEAIALGEKLFFEPRISGTGSVLCATCHVPWRQFQDGRPRAFGDEEALVDVGKALAAFQETLVSSRTPFDEFRDALERGDQVSNYPVAAQRGLRIFVGKANCSTCHFGPQFTNGEFADTGVPFFAGRGRVDAGRHGGIRRLKENPYNLLGRHNDDAARATATGTRHVELQHRNFGEFRVPGLRNVALTAPYMHNGSLATLRDVVKHYSELNEERLHADGERILKPLRLTQAEAEDLVAFLESLTEASLARKKSSPSAATTIKPQ